MEQHGYEVSQQWQSRFDELRVISDKKGGYSTLRLAEDPKLLHRLQKTVATDVKFVHVVKNSTTTFPGSRVRRGLSRGLREHRIRVP